MAIRDYARNILRKRLCCDLPKSLPRSTILPHPYGVIIAPEAAIGERCRIYQNVTIGKRKNKAPCIGNDVVIYAGATVLGEITVGDGAIIGACSLVLKDVAPNTTYKGVC